MSILIRNVLLEGREVDVFIRGARFEQIGPGLDLKAERVLDGRGKAIMPSFVNCHTHAAMTLFRGYADDMELHTWLENYIWPMEGTLSEEDVYVGAKLACLEMIKSGCTYFNDMYWYFPSTVRAVREMGIRAALSSVFIDFNDPDTAERRWRECLELHACYAGSDERIDFALGPHAVYSVSRDSLIKAGRFAAEHDLLIHIHLCETRKEVEDARQMFGMSPVQYLDELGLLGPNLCACHCIWLQERDMDLLAERGVKVVHNPVSNLKLCSGLFPYRELSRRGVTIGLGTDGCSSNNNLDLVEEMKFAALVHKHASGDPTLLSAPEVLRMATRDGCRIFGLDAGEIAEGRLADCILVDLDHPQLVPGYNLMSNMVYAANGACVDTTICNGRILMAGRRVEGEREILEQARETARKLEHKAGRAG
jgi:5-methylthioadenosine/S-adenosylhomocysteine deaminase